MISVVIPTIDGREQWLAKALHSFAEYLPKDHALEYLIYDNRPTCGIAWNEGYKRARGDYILFSADDIEVHAGWAEVGIEWIERGVLPAPRILNTDGSLQSCGNDTSEQDTGTPTDVARIPFCSREQMECIFPVILTHYCGDYWFTWKGMKCGYPSLVVRDFLFTHHLASEGRKGGMNEDYATFLASR